MLSSECRKSGAGPVEQTVVLADAAASCRLTRCSHHARVQPVRAAVTVPGSWVAQQPSYPANELPRDYPDRSASIGLTPVARRAGSAPAANATIRTRTAAPTMTAVS